MKRVILIGLICGLVLAGCSEPGVVEAETTTVVESEAVTDAVTEVEVETETETETVEVVVTERVTETETEVETEDPYFGLTEEEIEYIMADLPGRNVPCSCVSDLLYVGVRGYFRSNMPPYDVDYSRVSYDVVTDFCPHIIVSIPVSLLEEWGVDVEDRVSK